MTKEMAQAMLVAQRFMGTRVTAKTAKDAANNLLHNGLELSEENRKKVYAFMDMCEWIYDSHSDYAAKQYVEGLNNG